MFDIDSWQEIWITITRNKTRSFLTCFGVFWGILMLVLLLGAGNGLERGMFKNVDGFAAKSCFFWNDQTSEPYKGFKKGRSWSMRNRDLDILRQKVKGIEYLSPMIWGARPTNNVVYEDKSATHGVRGVYPDFFKIEAQYIKAGRLINDIDIMDKRKVCLIGTRVSDNLFKSYDEAIGKYIRVNGIYYQVAGVIKAKPKANIGGRTEDSVILPITTLQQTGNFGDVFHFLCVTALPEYTTNDISGKIMDVLKANNQIAPNDTQAVGTISFENQFKTFEYLFIGIATLIWIVGLGTLLAGVIGVSNIMLVTVRERTREIGVRRALGATPKNILLQIMNESLLITSAAGLLGLVLGVAILDGISQIMMMNPSDDSFIEPPTISISVALYATAVLLMSGLLSGLIPAWRALQIKAIDAIRDE